MTEVKGMKSNTQHCTALHSEIFFFFFAINNIKSHETATVNNIITSATTEQIQRLCLVVLVVISRGRPFPIRCVRT